MTKNQLNHFCLSGAEYVRTTTWDNVTIASAEQVKINLENHDVNSFKIVIRAPLYDDPPSVGELGQPNWRLLDFECNYMT